ncbi:MAG: hypothetical protein AB1758_13560 [Candidatus Eremiobacterota bacterium]
MLEVLLGGLLGLLLLGLAVHLLFMAFRTLARDSARTELQQSATLALDSLAADLRQSAPESISLGGGWEGLSQGTRAIGVDRIASVSADVARLYEPCLIVYSWDPQEKLLTRQEVRTPLSLFADPRRPVRMTPAELADVDAPRRILARGVVDFQAGDSSGLIGQPFPLRLSLEREVPYGRKVERFTLIRDVFLTN